MANPAALTAPRNGEGLRQRVFGAGSHCWGCGRHSALPNVDFVLRTIEERLGVEREEGKVGLEERREQKWRMSPQVLRLSKSAVSSNASGEKGQWMHGMTPLSSSQALTVFCELPGGSPSRETLGHAINPSQIFSGIVELHSSDPD